MENRIFSSKDKEGKEVTLRFNRPSQKTISEGDFLYRQQFSNALRKGILTTAEATRILKENGTWGEKQEEESAELRRKIKELEEQFQNPGLSNEVGEDLVKEVRTLRVKLQDLTSQYTS